MSVRIFLLLLAMAACHSKPSTPAQQAASENIDTPKVATPAVPEEPAVDAYLIVPGKAIGNTRIDENMEQVVTLLGKPDDGDAAMQKSVAIYYQHHDKKSYVTSILSARGTGENPVAKVKQIRVTSPAFKTAEGLHVGSTQEEISKTFKLKKVGNYTASGNVFTIWDAGKGIGFETNSKKACVAVIVYSPEKPYQVAALNIRPNRIK